LLYRLGEKVMFSRLNEYISRGDPFDPDEQAAEMPGF
jgi:hypothetical protein